MINNMELHTTLNHIQTQQNVTNDKIICVSSSIRYRHKEVTICYYKPNLQIK